MNTLLLLLVQVLDANIETLVLIGIGLLFFILTVALCRYLLDCVSRTFEAICNWLEQRLARRKVRRRSFAHMKQSAPRQGIPHKQSPRAEAVKGIPKVLANISPCNLRRPINAQEALRRSCSNQAETDTKVSNGYNTRGSRHLRFDGDETNRIVRSSG